MSSSRITQVTGGFLVAFFLAAVIFGGQEPTSAGSPAAAPVPRSVSIGQTATVRPHATGCGTRDDLEMLADLAHKDDHAAFVQMIASGRCESMEGGQMVDVQDVSAFSDAAQVRPRGQIASLWVRLPQLEPGAR